MGVWVRLGEVSDGDGQDSGSERGRVTDAQAQPPPRAAHPLEHLVGLLEQVAGFAEHRFTNGREPNRVGLALQQALADFVLQRFDLPAQGGLAQKNLFGGAADVAVVGDRHEVT